MSEDPKETKQVAGKVEVEGASDGEAGARGKYPGCPVTAYTAVLREDANLKPFEQALLDMRYDLSDCGKPRVVKGHKKILYIGDVVTIVKKDAPGWPYGIFVGVDEKCRALVKNDDSSDDKYDLVLEGSEIGSTIGVNLMYRCHPGNEEEPLKVGRLLYSSIDDHIREIRAREDKSVYTRRQQVVATCYENMVVRFMLDKIADRRLVAELKREAEVELGKKVDYDPTETNNGPKTPADLEDAVKYTMLMAED